MATLLYALYRNAASLVTIAALLTICYTVLRLLYNIVLHPLRSYPGPLICRLTILPKLYHLVSGDLPQYVAALHERYGLVVRIAPHELAFADPLAWKDVYGRRASGEELLHDPTFYNAAGNTETAPSSVLGAPRQEHDAMRKALAPAFAPTALRAQEPVIGGYVDMLMEKLRVFSGEGKPANMTDYLTFTTFDVVGTLAFNSDFGCLQNSDYHPWIRLILGNLKNLATMQVDIIFPPLLAPASNTNPNTDTQTPGRRGRLSLGGGEV
jgi:hypothetical protein